MSESEKMARAIRRMFGAMIALAIPGTIILWVWSGDYRPLLTMLVVTCVLWIASIAAKGLVEDEQKANGKNQA